MGGQPSTGAPRVTGEALTAGSVLFFAAMLFIPYTSTGDSISGLPLKQALVLLASKASSVQSEMTLYIAGSLVTLLGLVALARAPRDADDWSYAGMGLVLATIGAALIRIIGAYQMSLDSGFARQIARTSDLPDLYTSFAGFEQVLLNLFDAVSDLAVVAFAVAIATTRCVPRWAGWAVIGLSGLALLAFVGEYGGDAPVFAPLATLVLGIILIFARPPRPATPVEPHPVIAGAAR